MLLYNGGIMVTVVVVFTGMSDIVADNKDWRRVKIVEVANLCYLYNCYNDTPPGWSHLSPCHSR